MRQFPTQSSESLARPNTACGSQLIDTTQKLLSAETALKEARAEARRWRDRAADGGVQQASGDRSGGGHDSIGVPPAHHPSALPPEQDGRP